MASLSGDLTQRVSGQAIHIQLPDQAARGWFGILWLIVASFPAALGGGVLHPAINSLITKSADKHEVGGILGISAGMYSAANTVAPLFYGSLFQWLGGARALPAGRRDSVRPVAACPTHHKIIRADGARRSRSAISVAK